MNDLSGRVALVTGSSRGIGRAIAFGLGRAGADVVINYRHSEGPARDAVNELQSGGGRAIAVRADVSQASEVHRLMATGAAEFGPVDVLVNNAGIARPQSLDQITEADWDELIQVNLKSCFLLTQAVLPAMRNRKWGRIINISSVAAQVGGVVGPHYAASKAGMIGLTHSYAHLLAKEGITVNAIAPALIETDMVTTNLNAKPDRIPLGRFGHVEEVASVAVMLVTNGYMTGQTININGGWYMTS
jgi:3-oxoacyl-[acyl-carrier protein] reductase